MSEEKFRTEEFRVDGEELLRKIKNLIQEGNIRRVIIKDKDGKIVFEIPLTFGVVGALIAPGGSHPRKRNQGGHGTGQP